MPKDRRTPIKWLAKPPLKKMPLKKKVAPKATKPKPKVWVSPWDDLVEEETKSSLKKRAAVKAAKAKPTNGRRKRKMTTKTYGSDDNGAPAKGAKDKAVPDAALTQEQVDAGVKAVFAHPGGDKLAKPDDLVRSVDAAVHGYEQKPAE